MGKCQLYYDLISASLGVLVSISAFIVFLIYENTAAGCWAGFSGFWAGMCLQLHVVYWKNLLDSYYTTQTLRALEGLGFAAMVTGLAAAAWYIFAIIYWHTSMLPVKGSLHICAVWTLITSKWGLVLFLSSRRYSSNLRTNFTPFTPLNQSF